jgi:hypothetical protein
MVGIGGKMEIQHQRHTDMMGNVFVLGTYGVGGEAVREFGLLLLVETLPGVHHSRLK